MMLTESEAATKICPLRILLASGSIGGIGSFQIGVSAIGESIDDATIKCLASGCLMWRWVEGEVHGIQVPTLDRAEGFCGLGGRPQ